VMQTLYRQFYKELKRGWTDEEFRAVCENVAGVPLQEIFEYASTTVDIDYNKYLGYAGLELEKPVELTDPYLGAIAEDVEGRLVLTAIEGSSPGKTAGLAVKDEVRSLEGVKVDAAAFNAGVAAKRPADKIRLVVNRGGKDLEVEVTLGHKLQRSFKIVPITNPDALQVAILKDWMTAKLP